MGKVSPNPVRTAVPSIEAATLDADVVIEDDRWSTSPEIAAAVQSAVAALMAARPSGLPSAASATIVLACDAVLASLNGRYRDKSTPTNVLSFPAGPGATDPGAPHHYLGDVVIAHETVAREAVETGIPFVHHVQHLAIHGLLHLMDYDHIIDADATEMEAMETRVLATLGVADPYLLSPADPAQKIPDIPLVSPLKRS